MNVYDSIPTGDDRPKWPGIYMGLAILLSGRSTCRRARVGTVVTSWCHNRVLAVGYNGNYRGGPNTCDSDEPGKCGCLHAEENCIIKLDYNNKDAKRLYTTTCPCPMCAKRIINAGIYHVTYLKSYRDTSGIELLQRNGVEVNRLSDTYITDMDLVGLLASGSI